MCQRDTLRAAAPRRGSPAPRPNARAGKDRFRPKAEVKSESLSAASHKLWFFDLLDFKPESAASTTQFSDSDLKALRI